MHSVSWIEKLIEKLLILHCLLHFEKSIIFLREKVYEKGLLFHCVFPFEKVILFVSEKWDGKMSSFCVIKIGSQKGIETMRLFQPIFR